MFNRSISLSDSNPSLDVVDHPEKELHGIAQGLALLKKKRKKFSASRNTSPLVPPANPTDHNHRKIAPPKKVTVLYLLLIHCKYVIFVKVSTSP